jgi:hypothetical protein
MAPLLRYSRSGKTVMKKETPRERVQSFIERRREDVGEFVAERLTADGYVQVRFEKATFYTPPEDKAVYRGEISYERPPLKTVPASETTL